MYLFRHITLQRTNIMTENAIVVSLTVLTPTVRVLKNNVVKTLLSLKCSNYITIKQESTIPIMSPASCTNLNTSSLWQALFDRSLQKYLREMLWF